MFVGDNAQGKTSVLEAIYYLATYTSLQSQSDRQLINFCLDDNEFGYSQIGGGTLANTNRKNTIEVRLIVDPTVNGTKRFKKRNTGGRCKTNRTAGDWKFLCCFYIYLK